MASNIAIPEGFEIEEQQVAIPEGFEIETSKQTQPKPQTKRVAQPQPVQETITPVEPEQPQEQMQTLTGGITKNVVNYDYDDIINSNLTKEQKIAEIKKRGEANRKLIERQGLKDKARIGLGAAMQGASAFPLFRVPIIGSAAGGALFDAGGAIMEGASGKDIAKRAGRGAAAGATIEGAIRAIPVVGRPLAKSKAGQAVINKANQMAKPILESKAVKNIGNVLTNDYYLTPVGRRKANIAKRRNTPLVDRMTPEQLADLDYRTKPLSQLEYETLTDAELEALTRPQQKIQNVEYEPSTYGVNEINATQNQEIADQINNRVRETFEQIKDYEKARKELISEYGDIDTIRKTLAEQSDEYGRVENVAMQQAYDRFLEKQISLSENPYIEYAKNINPRNPGHQKAIKKKVDTNKFVEKGTPSETKIVDEVVEEVPSEVRPVEDIIEEIRTSQPTPQIEPTPIVETSIPQQTGAKQSKFINTVKNSDLATDEVKNRINANYQTITNQETLQNAQNIIDNDFEGSIRSVLTNENPNALDIAMAEDLARRLQQTGNPKDIETAVEIIERTATNLSKAGQTIQAASMWGRLTPDGALLAFQRAINKNMPQEVKNVIDNANSIIKKANNATTAKEAENIIRTELRNLALTPKARIIKQLKAAYEKNGKIDVNELINAVKEQYNIKTITQADMQEFTQLANNIENATNKRQKDIATALLKRKIDEVTPAGAGKKLSLLQTAQQLLNFKTLIRNLGGNTLYGALEDITQSAIATPLDMLASLRTKQRTIMPTNLKTQFRGLKKGLKEEAENVSMGIDTSSANSKFDLPVGRTFRPLARGEKESILDYGKRFVGNNPIEFLNNLNEGIGSGLEKALGYTLRVPDAGARQAVYEEAVENMLRASGKKTVTLKDIENAPDYIKEQANLEALQRTFQDTNKFSEAASGFKNFLNAGQDFGLGDLIIKYPKTPANILSRGIDYSPIGLGRGFYHSLGLIAGKAPYNQRVANMEVARGLMGTGLMSTGLGLAVNKGVTGKREDKKKLQQNLMAQGNRPYSIPIGDKSYSYDWAVPASMTFGAGANLNQGDDLIEGVLSATDVLTEQPLLQGAKKAFGGGYQDIPEAFVDTLIESPLSVYPALLRQTAQAIDPYYRETKSGKKGFAGTAETAYNRFKSNVPFWSKTLPIKYDVTGQPISRGETLVGRIGQSFFNPANVSKRPNNKTLDRSVDLYKNTGESGALYSLVPNKITVNGEERRLTNKERSDYQRDLGRITQAIRENMFNDEEFNQLSKGEQIQELERYNKAINGAVKYALFGIEPTQNKKLANEILEYYDEY